MTDFSSAFSDFRAMPYPDRPELDEFQDWSSELLTADAHIAGYASRAYDGQIKAREIPGLAETVLTIESLRDGLRAIRPNSAKDLQLIGEYQVHAMAVVLDQDGLDGTQWTELDSRIDEIRIRVEGVPDQLGQASSRALDEPCEVVDSHLHRQSLSTRTGRGGPSVAM